MVGHAEEPPVTGRPNIVSYLESSSDHDVEYSAACGGFGTPTFNCDRHIPVIDLLSAVAEAALQHLHQSRMLFLGRESSLSAFQQHPRPFCEAVFAEAPDYSCFLAEPFFSSPVYHL